MAHRVQLNVSPTYADPNTGGKVRRGERMKFEGSGEGYEREAEGAGRKRLGGGEGDGVGSGC